MSDPSATGDGEGIMPPPPPPPVAVRSTYPMSISSPSKQPHVNLERIPISIVPRRLSQSLSESVPRRLSQSQSESIPTPSKPPPLPQLRIKGLSKGKPEMVESPPSSDKTESFQSEGGEGGKKRRGERGPDKNPNIDPLTGKRRYIKRKKNKRFGLLSDMDNSFEGDYGDGERKKKSSLISKYYTKSGRLRLSGHHRPRHYGSSHRHHRRHHRHHSSSYKYSDYYVTPLIKPDSDCESNASWEDIAVEDLGDAVWRPTDDLRLIINVLQTSDLKMVHRGVKFSCFFSLDNIEARWESLLYNKSMAKVSQNAIRNLPSRLKHEICSAALFSKKENEVLKKVKSTSEPKQLLPVMQQLIRDNAQTFLRWRSPKSLLIQWMHLRDFCLLCDQELKSYFKPQTFPDFESSINDAQLLTEPLVDDAIIQEKLIQRKMSRKKIKKLEAEVAYWQAVSEACSEIVPRIFADGSLAMLRGRHVRYLMRSKEITLGRRTDNNKVDADLALDGSTYKISRKQGIIQLRENGQFIILNQGKHAIHVNGRPLLPKSVGILRDNAVIQISLLSFVFLINHKVINELHKKEKMQNAIRRQSVIHCHTSNNTTNSSTRTKYFPPFFTPPALSHQQMRPSLSSSSLSLSSILSPTFSNTLPALNFSTRGRPPNPNNKLVTATKSAPPNLNNKLVTATKSAPPRLNKKSITNNSPNDILFKSGGGAIGTNSPVNNYVGNPYQQSWHPQQHHPQSQSQPPPLTATSRTSPLIYSTFPSSVSSASSILKNYPMLSTYPPYLITTSNMPTMSLIPHTTLTRPTTSLQTCPIVIPSPPTIPKLEPVKQSPSTIQFGDITIRPGFPPPSQPEVRTSK